MTTATDRAYAVIRAAIASGVYDAGEPLREEELAESASVSRTPVREALRRLDAEGLVDLLPNRGARVAAWSEREIYEIFDLRVRLEGHGARLAATGATEQHLADLRTWCVRMEEDVASNSFERVTEANNAFHRGVLVAAGNKRLESMVETLVQRTLVQRTFHQYQPHQLVRSCAHHREILEAIEAGDPDWAEAIMQAHVLAGRHVARAVAE